MKNFHKLTLMAILSASVLIGCQGTTSTTNLDGSSNSNEGNEGNENSSNSNEGNENSSNSNEGNENSSNSNEGNENSSNSSHYQGKDCFVCHQSGTSEAPILKAGGTIYTLSSAVNGTGSIATGHRIQLKMTTDASIRTFTSGRGTGNSNLRSSNITSSDKFTAQVIDASGNVVKTSSTDSHDGSRLNCNRCHTATGVNGAPGRIVNQ